MADIPGIAHLPLPQAEPFAPIVFYVIVAWGRIDEFVDELRHIMEVDPACVGVTTNTHSSFKKRLSHFERLACAYFSAAPAMVDIVRHKCATLRQLKGDRDHFAHGRYGIEWNAAGEPVLRVSIRRGDRFDARKYTNAELGAVGMSVGNVLRAFIAIAKSSFDADQANLRDKWKVPEGQVPELESLLRSIHKRYIQADLARLNRST